MTVAPLSVIVPVYNEAATIETILRKVAATAIEKEIIVSDDGSSDGTSEILARLQRELPLQVITHPRNMGKGRAIRSALERCRGGIILLQDADLESDPQDYPRLLAPFADAATTIVYGSRFLGRAERATSVHRLANWVITAMVNALFGSRLTDAETGYKVFRRAVAEGLPLRGNRFEFEVEFTCKVLRRGHRVIEIPVGYVRRSYQEGKKIGWRDGVYAVWVILCCRLNPRY